MKNFEEKIGYTFKNKSYLKTALTHSSYSNENSCENNERYEFLGDSILSLIISEKLFTECNKPEGYMSKLRASIVCEEGLATIAEKIDLAQYILLGAGEERNGGRNRPSIISDAFEALICAVFLDSDFETTKKWLLKLLPESTIGADYSENYGDYKGMLQEKLQRNGDCKITYDTISESGPDHDKRFECAVYVNGKRIASGEGRGKKNAEQEAAKKALQIL
ncbi:MAG: ribonuclease III [Ruminococcaceae bacterium]|nr:ribonuclease III [Oscillospiraceae bacterium]